MQRRPAFTLIEMLVSVALVLFIMVILTEAFGKGLESFRQLKSLGDMEGRLRSAVAALRRDLAADHFEGKRRLSEDAITWRMAGSPREGFFRHANRLNNAANDYPTTVGEGQDSDSILSSHAAASVLHFTVKLRGNDRSQFFSAKLPATSPLWNRPRTTFFNQPADGRFQENGTQTYSSQWAEVAYFLERNGSTAGSSPLYTLYRSQFVMAADNSTVNWDNEGRLIHVPESRPESDEMNEISCRPINLVTAGREIRSFYVNNPTDINTEHVPADPLNPLHRHRRAFDPVRPTARAATPILTDVLSFEIHSQSAGNVDASLQMPIGDTNPLRLPNGNLTSPLIEGNIRQVGITLRIWDAKTKQSRQMTIFQDL